MSATTQPQPSLVDSLADRDCPNCDDGALEPAEFKNDAAAVCPDCGTPSVRVFA
jgi:hypothetical protein